MKNRNYVATNHAYSASLVLSNLSGFVKEYGRNFEGAVLHFVLESAGAVMNTKSFRQLFFELGISL